MTDRDRRTRTRTRYESARGDLLDAVVPVDRTESVAVTAAVGRVLASPRRAQRRVPRAARVDTDGYAVVASATFGASDRSPNVLDDLDDLDDGTVVDARTTVRVDVGDAVPDGADAVVPFADVTVFEDIVEVLASVTRGEGIVRAGERVELDATVAAAGTRLRAPALSLLRAAGVRDVSVYERPTVAVRPTGDGLVSTDERAEPDAWVDLDVNAPALAQLVTPWGGDPVVGETVPAAPGRIATALERDAATADLVVTTGGTGAGTNDHVADVVDDVGTVRHNGLAIHPGGTAGIGVVDDTPIVMLPGDPVSCMVTAHVFLRPALARAAHLPARTPPTTTATLTRKVASDPGIREFVPVRFAEDDGEDSDESGAESTPRAASPLGASGLASVARADGWVTIPESVEGVEARATVDVAAWEGWR
jgi:molybdopterin molybdotransferase